MKTHVGHILAKTGVRDRVALVVLAYQTGAVAPSPRPPRGRADGYTRAAQRRR